MCIEDLKDLVREIERDADSLFANKSLSKKLEFLEKTLMKVVRELDNKN